MKIIDQGNWQQTVHLLLGHTKDIFCTKNEKGTGFCDGDSGSGLIYNNTLLGIASSSYDCSEGTPSMYTRVYSQLNWIHEQMNLMNNLK